MGTTEVPGSGGEGDIDEDRQDPPVPEKSDTDDHGNGELDGFKSTPGDDPDEDAE
ncbi:MAG: hypothetical protein Q7T55_21075 [Solirubrobacteraceae bacterium]|nr:hypothetical protein [Solirubrobacteraceae bacterium]